MDVDGRIKLSMMPKCAQDNHTMPPNESQQRNTAAKSRAMATGVASGREHKAQHDVKMPPK